VTITVERDVAAVRSNIELFVKAFNDVNKLLGDISAANVQTGQNGILQGDAAVRGIQTALRRTLGTELNGAGALRNLTQIGVTFGKDGKLAIDAAKLDRALQDNFDDVAQLFAATGRASDPLVSYSSAGDKTQAGQYVLQISQLATRGWAVGAQAAGLTINSGNNDTLNFTIDGVAGTLALAAGTYASADALAAEVQSKLNGVAGLVAANVAVTVSAAAGVLTVQSNRYGSASSVNFTGGNGLTNLLGVPVATAGLDVAGSIGGVTASGSGQSLLAAGGAAEGLKVSITGGALGGRGTIDYSQGFAFRLDKLAAAFISSSGVLAARTDGLSRSIDTIEGRRRQMEQRLSEIEERYRQQFTSLDKLVSQLNSTSAFLNQQLARLPTISQE
jgi:flagellar hook-associated protein 2